MGYPASVQTVTVTFSFLESLPAGTPIPTGNVTFTPNVTLYDGTDSKIVVGAALTVQLVAGAGSAVVMATDDSHLTPSGWAYWVTFNVGGVSWTSSYFFPKATTPVDLSTLAPAVGPPALTMYVSLSAVGAPSGVASLDSGGQVPLSQLGNAPGGSVSPSGTVTASAVGDTGVAGASALYSRGDHKHAREAFGAVTSQTTYGASATNGTAATDARSDHVHGTPALPTPAAIGAQPVNSGLTAFAALADVGAAGFPAQTGVDTFAIRGLAGSTEIGITNPSGTAGNPTFTTQAVAPTASAVGDTSTSGTIATHRHAREGFGSVTAQTTFGASSTNGVAATDARSDHAHGTPALSANLSALSALAGTGILAQTGAGAFAERTITGSAETTVTNGDGVAGNPTLGIGSVAPTASAVGDTVTSGGVATHRHAREGFGSVTAQTTPGASSTNGVATTVAHSDHAHGTPNSLLVANNLSDLGSMSGGRANLGVNGSLSGYGPEGHNLAGWNFDPQSIASGTGQFIGGATPGKGIIAMNKIYVPYAQTITNVGVYIGAAGTVLTNSFLALIDINGNVLSVTAAITTAWQSTGLSLVALSAAQGLLAGPAYIAALVGNGSTLGPQFMRGGSSGVVGMMNVNLAAAVSRFATTGSALTAITGPITMSGLTQTAVPFWVCWS